MFDEFQSLAGVIDPKMFWKYIYTVAVAPLAMVTELTADF